jgi:hypothetical protein
MGGGGESSERHEVRITWKNVRIPAEGSQSKPVLPSCKCRYPLESEEDKAPRNVLLRTRAEESRAGNLLCLIGILVLMFVGYIKAKFRC